MTDKLGKDPKKIGSMFTSIADRYEFLNRLLSCGQDSTWRRKLIHGAELPERGLILDICTGTGDVALGFLTELKEFRGYVIGIDFSVAMLDAARSHVAELGAPYPRRVEFLMGDALDLNFPDEKFDLVSVAFGVRNYANIHEGLNEIHRVLKPGATVNILEFFRGGITFAPVRWYVDGLVPLIGNLVSGTEAYTYLRDSSNDFYTTDEFGAILEEKGFTDIEWKRMTFGIAHLVRARKK